MTGTLKYCQLNGSTRRQMAPKHQNFAPKNGASWRHFFWRHVAPSLNYERQKMAPRGAIFAPKWHQMVLLAKLAMLPVSPNKKWRCHFPLINANGWRHLATRGTIFSSYLFDTFMEWYFGTDVARQTLLPKYLNTRINGSVIIFNLYPILTMRNTISMIRTLPQEQFLRFFIFSILSKFWQNIQQKTSGKWRHVAPFFSENGAIWRWPTLTVPRASSRAKPRSSLLIVEMLVVDIAVEIQSLSRFIRVTIIAAKWTAACIRVLTYLMYTL